LKDVQVSGNGSNAAPVNGAVSVATAASTATVSANPGSRDASTGATVNTSAHTMVPLSTIVSFSEDAARGSVNHQDGELATTVSYNLVEGYSLSDAKAAIEHAEASIHMPINVRGSSQGTAVAAQQNNNQQPLLIMAAIVVIYIVLGVLYESLVYLLTV